MDYKPTEPLSQAEQIGDLRAAVDLLNDEMKAALEVVKLLTGALITLEDKLALQAKLLVLLSKEVQSRRPPTH